MLTPQVNNCFELPRSRLDEWWSFEMKRIGGEAKQGGPRIFNSGAGGCKEKRTWPPRCKTSEPKSSSWQLRMPLASISISCTVILRLLTNISWDVNMVTMGAQLRSCREHQAINQSHNAYMVGGGGVGVHCVWCWCRCIQYRMYGLLLVVNVICCIMLGWCWWC